MKRAAPACLGAFLLLSPPSARAEEANLEQARMYFNAGVQAYTAGRFAFAIQAFDQANRLAPRPAIVFSLAQAERKQYYVAKQPEVLAGAIKHFHAYLDQVASGGRRDDAANALAELEPLAARLSPEVISAPAAPAAPPTETGIMISSKTQGAVASVDGGRPVDVPFMQPLKPGKHRVHVSAPGFQDDDQDVVALPGATVPYEITLREKPALLWVQADAGADIVLDGRTVASTPLQRPVEASSGSHYLAVTKNGRKPFAKEVALERGKTTTVPVHLETTTQRVISYGVLGVGAAGLLAGGAFLTIALVEQGRAQQVLTDKGGHNIGVSEIGTYNDALSARDGWRTAGLVTLGASVAVLATGGILYLFDHPSPTAPGPTQEAPPKPATPPPKEPMEMSAVPMVGPGSFGAVLVGRF